VNVQIEVKCETVYLEELSALGGVPFPPEPGELDVRIPAETVSGRRFHINALAAALYQ
jgi:hypothetical protein